MLNAGLNNRLAETFAGSALAFSNAVFAAHAHATAETMKVWANAAKAFTPEVAAPKSWFRVPDPPTVQAASVWPLGPWPFTPWMAAPPLNPVWPITAPQPYMAWWHTVPFQNSAWLWPMTATMMSAGFPYAVAWPAAKANVAAMDAVDTATRAVETTFSAYRSDSGFATAQIMHPNAWAAAMSPAAVATAFWPWLKLLPAAT